MQTATRIFAVGETLLDIIFRDGKPVSATPGGSMLNTAVSLGRLGLNVHLISEYGKDAVGDMIDSFLSSNGVATGFVYRYDEFPSSLALAFLDGSSNASYSFYKRYPDCRLDVQFPTLTPADIIIFGSFYGLEPDIHARLNPFLHEAHRQNATVIYDPNFRRAHLSNMDVYRPVMMENFAHADIVKGSDEDFAHIFHAQTGRESWKHLEEKSNMLIYTAGGNDVSLFMHNVCDSYPVPHIQPISTIGAGDTFNAGLISALAEAGIDRNGVKHINATQRKAIINRAINFAAHVCMSYENYISPEFAGKMIRDYRLLPQAVI